eukprot:8600058-Pyramimonas_sp.AAC.4
MAWHGGTRGCNLSQSIIRAPAGGPGGEASLLMAAGPQVPAAQRGACTAAHLPARAGYSSSYLPENTTFSSAGGGAAIK